jgi:dynein heavy chain
MSGKDKLDEPQDKRITWIEQRFAAVTKYKDLRKLFDSDESKAPLLEFLDVPERMAVFLALIARPGTTTGTWVVLNHDIDVPGQVKKVDFLNMRKVIFFRKLKKEKIVDDKVMNTSVTYGDVGGDVLQSFHSFASGVMLPLMKVPANVKGSVPDVKYATLVDESHKLVAQSLMTLGRHQDKTLLPIPPIRLPDRITPETVAALDQSVIHQLESAVTLWTDLIKQAIRSNPEALPEFLGRPAGPLDEVAFWKSKAENIKQLEQQLCKPFVVKATVTLKFAASNAYPGFHALGFELHDALLEANEIKQFLTSSTLLELLEQISPAYENDPHQPPRSRDALPLHDLVEQRVFRKLFRLLYAMWTSSERFSTTARMVHFISLIVNDVIRNAKSEITVADVFQQDATEIVKIITAVLSGCGEFKAAYFFFKSKSAAELQRPWRFQNAALFAKLDLFLERCHDLLDLIETSALFFKLPNVKLGGPSGLHTSVEIEELQQRYFDAVGELSALSYDFLDVCDSRFETDYDQFRDRVRALEQRLAAIMSSALGHTSALVDTFKVVDSFEGFTNRPVVHQEWASKQLEVLEAWHQELLAAQTDFIENRHNPPRVPNMPATSTAIHWANSLLHRISVNHPRILELSKPVLHSELGDIALRLFEALKNNIRSYMYTTYEQWASTVGQLSHEKLQCFVLTPVPGVPSKFAVNFDAHLTRTLREVSHIEQIAQEHEDAFVIPPQVVSLHKQRDTLRGHMLRLDYVCQTVNRFEDTLLPCERALIDKELSQLAVDLQRGVSDIQWSSSDACARFVHELTVEVQQLERAIGALQSNLARARELFDELLAEDKFLPLTASKSDARVLPEADFTRRLAEHTQNREAKVHDLNRRTQELLDASLAAVNELKSQVALPSVAAQANVWQDYLAHAAGQIGQALTASLCGSLTHLLHQCDPRWLQAHGGIPLIEVKLSVTRPRDATEAARVLYEPMLVSTTANTAATTAAAGATGKPAVAGKATAAPQTLMGLVMDAAARVVNLASLVQLPHRDTLPAGEPLDFSAVVRSSGDVGGLLDEIQRLVRETAAKAQEYEAKFAQYSFLYETDMQRRFRQFLLEHGGSLAQSSIDGGDASGEATDALDEEGKAAQPPSHESADAPASGERPQHYFGVPLETIDVEIRRFEELEDELEGLPSTAVVTFVRVDSKPLRHGLLDLCVRWRNLFSGYLTHKMSHDLKDLYSFMESVELGLQTEVVEGDIESLKSVMRCVRKCRQRHEQVQAMMDPISQAAHLLKQHPRAVAESTLEHIEELRKPALEAWAVVHRKCLNVREQHSRSQDREAENVHEDTRAFKELLDSTGAELRATSLYSYKQPADTAYDHIDRWANSLDQLEAQAAALWELQELFDLTKADFRELKDTRLELVALKHLWDLANHVTLLFRQWMTSPFSTVDVDGFLDEIKKLIKQLKGQPMKARGWNAYVGLEQDVQNMNKSLPLCAELRSPAMRPRHWQLLVRAAGKSSADIDPEDPSFTLERLIGFGIHHHAEEVLNIVEKAQKELLIEKALTKIVSTWEALTVDYVMNTKYDTFLLGAADHIIEQLEADSQTLQSMLSNRFVEFFLDKVQLWQKNLGLVDSCLNKWLEIQRKWVNLYPIFVLSADIREQLPDDARNFAVADELFRQLMRAAQHHTNVVELLCSPAVADALQRADDLEHLLNQIEGILVRCEKALSEYLETKRKIFPRFYFVSASDLVDILSKGSDPRAVMTHMSKMIDSVDVFSIDGNPKAGAGPKQVWQMVSVQGEEVALAEDYVCDGPVEHWLAGCITAMQKAIRFHIQDANAGYTEKPRTEWIYAYPCQAVIVASRTWFTTETQAAFQQAEDGTEGAMKEFLKAQRAQLDTLVKEVLTDKKKNDRKMLVHLITIDVHNRDIIQGLVDEKIDSVESFQWQSQLRYYWDDVRGSQIRICDAEFINGYEYIGLCGCLVITPLTDRCYITLSQALKLKKGGAPAGPAGTGKTETTKDLARNLGICCYVFNCSDQMNYITLGQIFKGLAMAGAWGCFDEFNRISIEVLSVVATQVGSILNALKGNKRRFRFMDEEISLTTSVGMFITMNPGYAGRTELPENIKSLFRPCAMVVPDLKNICEIMLAAEGFGDAKDLALKFVTLYKLNKELLSPQDHYDWGLRAVKSVLYIAGALKRDDPDVPERKVLMRALRDTNLAKLSRDDVYVFMGLIRALFPQIDIPKKSNEKLQNFLLQTCKEMGLYPGENEIFILKCLQYEELLHVRHSVFILGPAGCGKTECWRCLQGALAKSGDKCVSSVLNPKAISSNELYGYIHPQTKEWYDGILSNIFRSFYLESKVKKNSKWIVLDGIIDAEWIESMNTVMDDNKMLTLVSNERIPLSEPMRMIFEVSHLKNASPATVSRAGVLFINESDLGYGPFKDKWLDTRQDERERTHLDALFERYVPVVFDYWHRSCKPIVAMMDINVVQTICFLLEGLLANIGKDKPVEVYEKYFCFALVWAFGGPLPDGRIDYRGNFTNWWRKEFPHIKIGETGQVFDYFIDATDKFEFKPWSSIVPAFVPDPEVPLAASTVPTADTVRMTKLMSLLVDRGRPVMLVGTAGTGKSNLLLSKLASMDSSQWLYRTIAFNARTGSASLQAVMEQSLDRRTGKQYGPPNRKTLIFFLDDVNMPAPDKYGTQEAIALLQQHIEYGFWYDRQKIIQKEIVDVKYVAAMNPKSGTFTILDRVLRHFALFATNMPSKDDLETIYRNILSQHLAGFNRDIQGLARSLTVATIDLQIQVNKSFLPTAVLFHYQWNMRELFNIFQGLCNATPKLHSTVDQIGRLWAHECRRTYRDRLPLQAHMDKFDELLHTAMKQIPEVPAEAWSAAGPRSLWAPFATTKDGDENVFDEYDPDKAFKYVSSKMADYSSNVANLDLVLFEQALEHVCRISRVLANPRGNALLVGVGGSGKQSLARLAAYIVQLDIFQIQVTSTYGILEFRADMQQVYNKCGLKGNPYCFIITDTQIVSMEMLVYLNDMLSSGNVPELFNQDEREGIIGGIMNEVKASGNPDYSSPDVCWGYFINKVRSNLHIVLCLSPLSKTFAQWCRQFPALSNTTVIDWFHPWPRDALKSVAARFLKDVELDSVDMLTNISEFMAECHDGVAELAEEFHETTKRRCYVTPKSFLELIELYRSLLGDKRSALDDKSNRLQDGLMKIADASDQVAKLQIQLTQQSAEVEEARAKTADLLETVDREKSIVSEKSALAEVEQQKTNKSVQEVEEFEATCRKELAEAQPFVIEAKEALNTLDKASLTELKSMSRPPDDVVMVTAAVKVLTSDPRRIPPVKQRDWANCKQMMANVGQWMNSLISFDQDHIPKECIDALQMYVNNAAFEPESIKTKSFAAAGLCKWVIGMNKYYVVRCKVAPLEEKLAEAQERLQRSRAALKKAQDNVNELNAKLETLMAKFNAAKAEADEIERRAKKTQDKMSLAERLVGGLADEKIRWGKTIQELKTRRTLLVGDVLLAAAFVSYIGPFSRDFRDKALNGLWTTNIVQRGLPLTPNLDVVFGVLTTEAQVASWNNEGLPNDPVSTQNGAIMTTCARWPLMIDPQLQGVRWVRAREEPNGIVVVQQTQPKFLDRVVECVEQGLPCLIESLDENIDPVLDNVLGRVTYNRGSKRMIKIGSFDVEYHPKFRLVLQTKLSNPIYKPEINAQTTLINFTVTEAGLEDQLLAVVVNHERPDLEEKRVSLLRNMNTMTIELQQCEDGLLTELSNATGDILENVALVENLEATKKKAHEIFKSMGLARVTQQTLAESRQTYRPVAARGSLLFFQLDQLCKIDHMYQYSLEAFMVVFNKALDKAPQPEDPKNVTDRVVKVSTCVTESVFAYVARGLFERHKLIFSSLLCFAILSKAGDIDRRQLDFLLRGKRKVGVDRPESVAEWCSEPSWAAAQALAEVEGGSPSFSLLPADMAESNRWRVWAEGEKPEDEKLPTDWKNLTSFQRLLILRCLRPDRLTSALESFVAQSIGKFFVQDQAVDIATSYADAGVTTPLFFILSAGVDPVKNVERLGAKLGFTYDNDRLFNVSLGQGQEKVAENALDQCFRNGGWAMLNNVHLVEKWLKKLEKRLEAYAETYQKMGQADKAKAEKRTAKRMAWKDQRREEKEAAASTAESEKKGQSTHAEPESIVDDGKPEDDEELEAAETNEVVQGDEHDAAHADEKASVAGTPTPDFTDSEDDRSSALDAEGASATAAPRPPRGSMDFRIFLSAEPSTSIPLGILQRCIKLTSEPPTGIAQNIKRALTNFSDEPWDRSSKPTEFRAVTFAMCFFHAVVVERKKFGAQGWNRVYPFNVGDLTTCIDVLGNYIDDRPKVPWDDLRYVFGEIMYGGHITDDWDRTLCMAYLRQWIQPDVTDNMELAPGFSVPGPSTYQEYLAYVDTACPAESPVLYGLHPNAEINYRTVQAEALFRIVTELQPKEQGAGAAATPTEVVRAKLAELIERSPEPINVGDIAERLEDDRTPPQHVFYQEGERINALLDAMKRSFGELELGLQGALSMTEQMQTLFNEIFLDRVPEVFDKVNFATQRGLSSWFDNLNARYQQISDWTAELVTPKVTMLSYFFNPMSFLTAIMQHTAINFNYDLDQMALVCDVTKRMPDQIDVAARDGAYVYGVRMEGARFDHGIGSIEESKMKDLYPRLPVIAIRSLPAGKVDRKDQYECPLYKTQARGPTFVASLWLRTKHNPRRWVIGGVGCLLDVVE